MIIIESPNCMHYGCWNRTCMCMALFWIFFYEKIYILNIKKTSWTGINALIYIVLPKLRVENVLFIVTKIIQIHGVYNYIQYYILYIIDEHI